MFDSINVTKGGEQMHFFEVLLLPMGIIWLLIVILCLFVTVIWKPTNISIEMLLQKIAFSIIAIGIGIWKALYLATLLWTVSIICLLLIIYLIKRQRKLVLSAWD